MLLERLRRFCQLLLRIVSTMTRPTSPISGLMGEAQPRKQGSTKNAPILRRGARVSRARPSPVSALEHERGKCEPQK
jgi:hypothetical protein